MYALSLKTFRPLIYFYPPLSSPGSCLSHICPQTQCYLVITEFHPRGSQCPLFDHEDRWHPSGKIVEADAGESRGCVRTSKMALVTPTSRYSHLCVAHPT